MSRGYGFDEEDRLRDFPDLNKCPDCETFFADLNCPLCGKECPVEMRAGNRPAVKQPKRRRHSDNGRVTFVPWYLSTPFILIMLFVQPIIGLILLWISAWRKGTKIAVTALLAAAYILPILLGFLLTFLPGLGEEIPVETDIPRAEYVARCQSADPEDLYRNSSAYAQRGAFVTLTLTVDARLTNEEDYGSDYSTYYLCHIDVGTKSYSFLLRDWRQEESVNFVPGDVITVWGQAAGELSLYNSSNGQISHPGIHILYAELG